MKKTVFISYSTKDKETAAKVRKVLVEHGIDVKIDIESLVPGKDILAFIDKSIRETDVTLSIVSKNSLLSDWVALETVLSLMAEKFLGQKQFIPCFIDKEFLNKEFLIKAKKLINKEISDLDKEIDKDKKMGGDPIDLQAIRTRKHELKTNLSRILGNLHGKFTPDISEQMFDENMQRIIDAIKSEINCEKIGIAKELSNVDTSTENLLKDDPIKRIYKKVSILLCDYKRAPYVNANTIYDICHRLSDHPDKTKPLREIIDDLSRCKSEYAHSLALEAFIRVAIEFNDEELFDSLAVFARQLFEEYPDGNDLAFFLRNALAISRKKMLDKINEGSPPFYLSFFINEHGKLFCVIHDADFIRLEMKEMDIPGKDDFNISIEIAKFFKKIIQPELSKLSVYKSGVSEDQVLFRFYLSYDQLLNSDVHEMLDPRYREYDGVKLAHQSSLTIASYERALSASVSEENAKQDVDLNVLNRWKVNWKKINNPGTKIKTIVLDNNCDSEKLKEAVDQNYCIVFNFTPSQSQIESLVNFGACFLLWPCALHSHSELKLIKNKLKFQITDSPVSIHNQFIKVRKSNENKARFVIFWDDADRNALAHLQNDFFDNLDQ